MSTWVLGDLQGCYRTFTALLDVVRFNPKKDQLWLVGDLVNRGPGSLEVLRWCVAHRRCVTAVLGNHDLHLLGRAAGLRSAGRRDTLDPILHAPDREELLEWLRDRPLIHVERGFALVHAGLLPQWSLADAVAEAGRIEAKLRKNPSSPLLQPPAGLAPLRWEPEGPRRVTALAALTTLRCVDREGRIIRDFTGAPESSPPGARAWFTAKGRRWKGEATMLFGHWAALGHRRGKGWVSLDSGCVWGRALTGYRLEDGSTVRVPNQELRRRVGAPELSPRVGVAD